MKLELKKEEDNWVITLTLPTDKKRFNPYDEGFEDLMPTIIGVVDKDMFEWGFAWRIDMDYKGKGDQWTSNFLDCSSFMGEEEFIKLCNDNGIGIVN